MSSINDKLIQLAETKSNIRDAIISKGVEVDTSLPFGEYANKIKDISGAITPTVEDLNIYSLSDRNRIFELSNTGMYSSVPKGQSITDECNLKGIATLTKPLSKYEISIHQRVDQLTTDRLRGFSFIRFRPDFEVEIMHDVDTSVTHVPTVSTSYWSESGSGGFYPSSFQLYTTRRDAIVRITFSNNTITVKYNDNYVCTYNTNFDFNTYISDEVWIGLLGDGNHTPNGVCNGFVYFKDTYVKDLETGEYVYELVNGTN